MFLLDDHIVHSTSDLARAADCEFALLRRFDAKLGRGEVADAADGADPMLARTSALGDAHEHRRLVGYRERFGDGVVVIERPKLVGAALTAAATATLDAANAGADVIYQGTFFQRTTLGGRFLGFCDFLVRGEDGYQVIDTKLSRHARVPALLQLAAYADALRRSGIPTAPTAGLVLGDETTVSVPLADVTPVFERRRDALARLLDDHRRGGTPVSWGAVRACGRCESCTPEVTRSRDLVLVAGLRSTQRETLIRGGITTIDALAAADRPVHGMTSATFDSLRAQAAVQVRSEPGEPDFEVIGGGAALAGVPAPDPGDIFFDFEGDPLWAENGSTDWGLEYLFGVMEPDGTFRPFWAHDREQERRALLDFLDYVTERRKRFPHMHVYHYAAYEKTALLRLAGRYGVGEDAVDTLLRDNVLVDLYPVVRGAVRVGAPSYSIKKLEPLYMGDQLRSGDVTDAGGSIVAYADYCDLRDAGRGDDAAVLLKGIAAYNEYDCLSTLRLRDWLLGLAADRGVRPHPVQEALDVTVEEPDPSEVALRAHVGDALAGARSSDQQAAALMAAALGYHRRERKPFWWAHFERLTAPTDEWSGTADVLVVESATVVEDWHKSTPRQRKLRRRIRLVGAWGTGSTVRVGDSPFALYDAATGVGFGDAGSRGTAGVTVVALDSEPRPDGNPRDVVIVEELQGEGTHDPVPMALAPGRPVPTRRIEASIAEQASAMVAALPSMPGTAAVDILRRIPPRTLSGATLPVADPDNRAPAIVAALLDLDDSYLAVQGPPGTGKTHTGAAVVADLVTRHGWRVGVVAQSHSVVENMLDAVVRSGVPGDRVAKKPGSGVTAAPEWTELDPSGFPEFLRQHESTGCVIGGTAWDFAHSDRVPPGSLDLLVVDEAGQFALANTVAVGNSARNLLLLGDPQQLPQVSQGIHPEPVDTSALGWLAHGDTAGELGLIQHGALPPELGYFLDVTWRMHPDVCAPVSALSYDGRLHSKESVTRARHLDGVEPGVHAHLVDHVRNSTSSPEEAAAITAAATALIGARWTASAAAQPRPLTASDLLVVAPFNAQVTLIRAHLTAAGLGDVLVGTVDKFQGREAAVVFVSMTASSAADVPRGIGFLLSRNRLNVALSRGMWRAVIVRSPSLTDYLPTTPAGLTELGAFLRTHHSV
ncbi:bifunctional RecB family nuclease/DEAD/DEAH box helicase [Rhodococcus sp. Q]|uniref:TM0106 family RecB-like putative nuclease n=1 Tax=Rhodococcus sp. Q TaxID=2502252 RepID=UPI0010F72054|nr:bifunctional RecB family nuclease/DEAD/DEAH box helicase [Rhodococcus sp. Q]